MPTSQSTNQNRGKRPPKEKCRILFKKLKKRGSINNEGMPLWIKNYNIETEVKKGIDSKWIKNSNYQKLQNFIKKEQLSNKTKELLMFSIIRFVLEEFEIKNFRKKHTTLLPNNKRSLNFLTSLIKHSKKLKSYYHEEYPVHVNHETFKAHQLVDGFVSFLHQEKQKITTRLALQPKSGPSKEFMVEWLLVEVFLRLVLHEEVEIEQSYEILSKSICLLKGQNNVHYHDYLKGRINNILTANASHPNSTRLKVYPSPAH